MRNALLILLVAAMVAGAPLVAADGEGNFDRTLSVTGPVDLDVQTGLHREPPKISCEASLLGDERVVAGRQILETVVPCGIGGRAVDTRDRRARGGDRHAWQDGFILIGDQSIHASTGRRLGEQRQRDERDEKDEAQHAGSSAHWQGLL